MKKLLLIAFAVSAFVPAARANILTDLFGPPYVAPVVCNPVSCQLAEPGDAELHGASKRNY